MRKILCCILVLMLTVSVGAVYAVESTAVISAVCDSEVTAGESFDVYFTVSEGSNEAGGNFDICYDSEALRLIDVEAGSLLGGRYVYINKTFNDNAVRVVWAGVTENTSAGSLVKASFKAKTAYVDKTTEISIENLKIADSDSVTIASSAVNKQLTVKGKEKTALTVNSAPTAINGGQISVTVDISENSLSCGGNLNLVYDSSKLEIAEAAAGEVLSGSLPAINESYADGKVRLTWAGSDEITDGGTLMTAVFNVSETAEGTAEFAVEGVKMSDGDLVNIEYTASAKTVNFAKTSECSTVTVYTVGDEAIAFESEIYNCPSDGALIVALYEDEKMVDFKAQPISSQRTAVVNLPVRSFDSAKVMIWDSLSGMKPISTAEPIIYESVSVEDTLF